MAGSDIANQITQTADYNAPNVYNLLGFFSAIQTSQDALSSSYQPLSQVPFAAKNLKPFAIGLIPPSANVTGKTLDRSGTVASTVGSAAGTTAGGAVSGISDNTRANALALAQSYVGLSTNPATIQQYGNLLADPSIDNAATQAALVGQASCAPTVRGWLRQLGVQDPSLSNPYVWSQAPADVLNIANAAGARIDSGGKFTTTPQPGDVYYITGSAQHMGIIQSVTGDASTGKFTTVDISGGQQVGSDGNGNVYNGIGTATRTWTQDPNDGSWHVQRTDGLDIVGAGDDPRGREVGALIDISKVLANVPVTPGAGTAASWQGSGSADAQSASQQLSSLSGTQLNASNLTAALTAAQQATIAATQAAISQMANTPPLRMLVNPTSFKVGTDKIISDGNWGRNGPIVQHWGEQQDKIDGSGKIAGFYAIDVSGGGAGVSPGLTRMARNVSLSYMNFLSLFLIYRNNGGIWLPDPTSPQTAQTTNLTLVGSVYLYYDSIIYIGSFDSFTITESDSTPFTIEYNFSFSVRATFVLDSTNAQLNYGAPATLPGTL